MNKLIILSFFFLSDFAISAEIKAPCLKKDGSLGLNLEKYDCKLIAKVVESPEIKVAHEDKVLDVLANQLSFKIKRNMENMAVIDNYFGPLNLALTEDKVVRNNCNIDVITSLSSSANKCSTKNPKKLEKLISKLTDEMGAKSKAIKDLRSALREKFFSSRGVSEIQGCPLNKSSGYYMLNSQLSDVDLKNIFDRFKKSGKSSYKDLVYKTYPQLKIIAGSKNPEFQEKFEKYVSDFQGTDEERVEYFYNFFKSENNQDKLSLGLANNCIDVKSSIETYMCNDLDHLGMSDDYVENVFSEEKDSESVEIAKAFNCSNSQEGSKFLESKNNIENWMDVFQKNTVPMQSEQTAESNVMNFCDIFLCKDLKAKEQNSCKSGSQISSSDLEKMYGCKEKEKACTEEVKKRVVYLESLEKIFAQKKAYELASSSSSGSTSYGREEKKKSSPYSSFFQNFVGVEGTLQAEGKKISPATVAEKVREFEDKKIEPIPSTNKDIILANNDGNKVYNMIKQQKQEEALNQQAQANQQVAQHSFVPSIKENDDHKQAVIANSLSKFKGAVGSSKDEFQASREHDRKEEISRMRSELEGVLKEMKGSEEDKLATITDSNTIFAQPKSAGKDDPYKGMSAEERERLENYRSNLATWESRLRARESDVLDRELRIGSRSTASTNDSNEKRFENGNTNTLGQDTSSATQNSAHAGSANANGGLKLTKAQAAAGAVQASGEAGVAQASGKISESEAIVAAENLATLEKATLKKWGLSARDSFVIKVRLLDRIVDVPVKSFTYSGKSMFVPILTKENRELSKLILESPLFSDYRQYQQERLKVLDRI